MHNKVIFCMLLVSHIIFYSSNLSGQVIADRNYAPGEQVRCISIGMVFIPLLNNYIYAPESH